MGLRAIHRRDADLGVWAASQALALNPPPPQPKPPITKIGNQVLPPAAPRRYHFDLTKGKGKPVCEAYLQRLNQTEFFSPPYCGRPESTLVPGFALLHRRLLSIAEYRALFFDASAVLSGEPCIMIMSRAGTRMAPPPLFPLTTRSIPALRLGRGHTIRESTLKTPIPRTMSSYGL